MIARFAGVDSPLVKFSAVVVGAVATLVLTVTGGAGASSATCGSGENGRPGYGYAGHQASSGAHGVRARITLLDQPTVPAGHVAGWIGVGGPKSGPGGTDQWLQVGIAGLPQTAPMLYAEIVQAGRQPIFLPLEYDLQPGATRTVAVLEQADRPGWWRVWVGDRPVTRSVELRRSAGRFQPIATAESWNGGRAVCNGFRFRFEHVGIAAAPGGSWKSFRPGYDFLDRGYLLRPLTPTGRSSRLLSAPAPLPYAFEASSP
jgi:hypothetical protein